MYKTLLVMLFTIASQLASASKTLETEKKARTTSYSLPDPRMTKLLNANIYPKIQTKQQSVGLIDTLKDNHVKLMRLHISVFGKSKNRPPLMPIEYFNEPKYLLEFLTNFDISLLNCSMYLLGDSFYFTLQALSTHHCLLFKSAGNHYQRYRHYLGSRPGDCKSLDSNPLYSLQNLNALHTQLQQRTTLIGAIDMNTGLFAPYSDRLAPTDKHSNYICAPCNIIETERKAPCTITTYSIDGGTSTSTAYVTGLASQLLEVSKSNYKRQTWDLEQHLLHVQYAILLSGRYVFRTLNGQWRNLHLEPDNYGYGLIDSDRALKFLEYPSIEDMLYMRDFYLQNDQLTFQESSMESTSIKVVDQDIIVKIYSRHEKPEEADISQPSPSSSYSEYWD